MNLDRKRLERSLNLLGAQLESENRPPLQLIVSGGAALIATGTVSRGTYDLDILALRGEIDGEIEPAWPLPDYFTRAAQQVAEALQLKPNWANANTSLLMVNLDALPDELWSEFETREYGKSLMVHYITRTGQIYLKIWAAIDRSEPRDISDLKSLAVKKHEAEAVLDWLVREELLSSFQKESAMEVMNEIGHEGVVPKFT